MNEPDRENGIRALRKYIGASDDAISKLLIYERLLIKWQKAQNLVSRETIDAFWTRHICDSARLLTVVKRPAVWMDIGSGAGLPGLVSAILQHDRVASSGYGHVYLVESNTRKAAFLRAVIRETGVTATVFNDRIEAVFSQQTLELGIDYISARALAPLSSLLGFCQAPSGRGVRCFFHKGRDIDAEIAEAADKWNFDLVKHAASLSANSSDDGIVLEVSHIRDKFAKGRG